MVSYLTPRTDILHALDILSLFSCYTYIHTCASYTSSFLLFFSLTPNTGLPLEDILPDDSYIREAFKTRSDAFGGTASGVTVVVKDQDFNDLAIRTKFIDASNQVGNLTDVVVKLPNW